MQRGFVESSSGVVSDDVQAPLDQAGQAGEVLDLAASTSDGH